MKKVLIGLGIFFLILLPLSGQEEVHQSLFPWPLAIVGNVWLPGFGVGSFIQGDWVGGAIQATTQLLAGFCGAYVFGLALSDTGSSVDPRIFSLLGLTSVWISYLSRAWGMVRPITYAEKYDAKFQNQDEVQPKSSVAPVILNILPSLGAGSFLQGDHFGGTIQFIVETIGFSIGLYSGLAFDYGWDGDALQYIGVGVFGGAILWGIIRPIWFAHEFNGKIQENKVTFCATPSITLSADHRVFDVGIELAVRCTIN